MVIIFSFSERSLLIPTKKEKPMSIELKLTELTAAITNLSKAIADQTATVSQMRPAMPAAVEAVAEVPVAKAKVTKVKAEAQPVEAVQAAPVEATKPAADGDELSLEDIMPVARELVDMQQGDLVVQLLKNLTNGEVTKISALPKNCYAAFLAVAKGKVEELKSKPADPLA